MEIKKANTCINCDHLMPNHLCEVNETLVTFDQTCDSFDKRLELHKNSDCGNCAKHEQTSCAHPDTAVTGMLCTSYSFAGA
ncbi:hypothetical protein [Persicobacter diffluens]|uniref:Uncharacterized protein n=1 Tax=Persicobacter diffluens TaxID=981 RepID=A0AAN4W371_9BACT|nr:hypothetical protein PEDI_39590 [Persicobacter diffluens]